MITREGAKMSKSKGNVISPAPYVERYGADTARCYILFIGPPDQDADWSDEGVEGVYRFLGRLWRLGAEASPLPAGEAGIEPPADAAGDDLALLRKAHWAIDKVTRDLAERFAFNTAIAAVMELVNDCYRLRDGASADALRFATGTAASLIFPFAPHAGADVYDRLYGRRVWEEPWPQADPALLEREVFELVCQVNGRVRDRVQAPADASGDELAELCRAQPNVRAHLDGKEIVKEVVVPGKLVNLVVR
jgi:leucyl-tRNA synthetase